MDVRLPDGTIIQNVPDGTTKAELTAKLKANGYDVSGFEPSEREQLRSEGRRSVEKSMSAEPEYIEVPVMSPDGASTGATERVLKPSKADPIGRGAMSVLPFGEDIGALSRSMSSGRTLSQEKMMMEGEREAAKEAYPGAYTVGQAAGIVPQLYLPAGLAARGSTATGKAALGALEGAGYGAVTGLGEGVTAEERLGSAKTGAIAGGVLGGALGRFAAPAAERAAPKALPGVEAAERLGVELPLYAATESPVLQRATKVAENLPGAGEAAIAARQRATASLENAIDSLVPKMTTEDAGRVIGQKISSWMTSGVREKAKNAYDEVRSLFENPGVTKQLDNTRGAVANIMAQRAEAKLQGSTPAIDLLLPAIQSAEGLSYDGAKTLYTALRDLRSENMVKGVKDANVDKLYNALKDDVLDIAEAAGGEPARFFLQKADREYRLLSNMREKLQKIVGKKEEAVSDEQIFNRLYNAARSGGSANNALVQRAITVMDPAGLKAFQAGILAKMGRGPDLQFSPDRWLGPSGINGLSPRAKAMIFKDEPKLLQALNDVTEVSKRFKNLNKYGNPSGTAQNVLGGISIGAFLADPVSTIASIAGANVFTRIMSKPATAESVANWSKRYENYVLRPSRGTAEALYRAGIPVSRALSSETGKEIDINKSITASRSS
jgi:hypothetical protein